MIYLIIILILIFVSYKLIGIHTRDIEINRLTIKNKKIKEELNILHLSDFHFNFDKKYQEKLLNMINKLEYDLLVLTGDYLNGEEYLINLEQFLKKIENNKKVYAVYGNNDQKFKEDIKKIFEENNITLLKNQSEDTLVNDNHINIIGVDTPDMGKDDYNKAVEGIDLNNNFNLLLSHTYHITEKEKLENIDLVLVGDTHGGQINLPILNKIADKKFDLKYKAGKYIIKDKILIVNKGIGTTLLPIRINCKPEIVPI